MFVPPLGLSKLLVRLFPLRASARPTADSLDQLRKKYRRWDYYGIAALLLFIPICVWVLHQYFTQARSSPAKADDAVYLLLPSAIFWYAPAAVLGVIMAWVLASGLLRLLLGKRNQGYRYYSNLRTGMNARGMYLAFAMLFGGFFSALAYFAGHSFLQLNESGIVLRRLWSLSVERHAYSQVKALKEARHRGSEQVDFIIEFDAAEDWTTAIEVIFPDKKEKAFLARRAGKQVEATEVD